MTLCVFVSHLIRARPVRVKWTLVNQANVPMVPPAHLQLTIVTTSAHAHLASQAVTVRMTSMSAPIVHAEMELPALTLMAVMNASAAEGTRAVTVLSTLMTVLPHPVSMVAPALMVWAPSSAYVWTDLVEIFAKMISTSVTLILVKMEQHAMIMLIHTRKYFIKSLVSLKNVKRIA